MRMKFFFVVWSLKLLGNSCLCSEYLIGAGIADVTGPAAELNMVRKWIVTVYSMF